MMIVNLDLEGGKFEPRELILIVWKMECRQV